MRKSILRSVMIGCVAVAGASASLSTSSEATAAPTTTIQLKDINEQLVPSKLLRGDREFGGNGPRIKSSVKLSVTADGRQILATVDLHAKETKADWSETAGSWTRTVYTAPAGKKIDGIVDGASSSIEFVSKPAGFQLLGPTEDFVKLLQSLARVSEAMLTFGTPAHAPPTNTLAKKQMKTIADRAIQNLGYLQFEGNRVDVRVPATGPVRLFAIVGDTGGADISTDENPKDDTRICAVKFKPIKVRLK